MPTKKEIQITKIERDKLIITIQRLEQRHKSGQVSELDYEILRERYNNKLRKMDINLGIIKPEIKPEKKPERKKLAPTPRRKPKRKKLILSLPELKLGRLIPRDWKDVFRGLGFGSMVILLAIFLVMNMAYPCSILATIAISLDIGGLASLGGGWLMVLVLWWIVAPFVAGLAAGNPKSGAWAGLFTCLIFPIAVILLLFVVTGGAFAGSALNLVVNGLVGVSIGLIGGCMVRRTCGFLYKKGTK